VPRHRPPATVLRPELAQLRRLNAGAPAATELLPRSVDPRPAQPTLPLSDPPKQEPTSTLADHQARQLAAALVTSLVEVIAGRRPAQQLSAWVSPEVYVLIEKLAKTQRGSDIHLRSIRVQTPRPQVIEIAVHLVQRGRSKAAALRLHIVAGRWQATGLEIALEARRINQARAAA
jgi:Family of unknown function (DUF6459)